VGNLWVANDCGIATNPEMWKINAFAVGAVNATNAPVASIGGVPNVEFAINGCCASIAIDSSNRIYTANILANSISQFNASGSLLSTLTEGASGQASNPEGIAFDSSGNLYEVNTSIGAISIYHPGQTTPAGRFWGKGANTCNLRGIAVDAAGHIFASDSCQNALLEFPAGSTNSGVTLLLKLSGGGSGLSTPAQINFDYAGNLYVANQGNNTITMYGNGLLGNGTPTATLGGGSTNISSPSGVAVDPAGYIYVLNSSPNSVTVYAPGATGNTAPLRTITGMNGGNGEIAVDQFQNVYVNNGGGFSVWGPTANGSIAPNITVNAVIASQGGIAISPTQP
jgi:sugar lactone lactonase YvrE